MRVLRECVIGTLLLVVLLAGCQVPDGLGVVTDVQDEATAAPTAWDERVAPNYYLVVGSSHFDDVPDVGEVAYEPLDALGRARGVTACVDYALAQAGTLRERDDTSGIHPSGWGFNERVQIELPFGGTYRGYFWNRSHLLAKSLGGEEIVQNLVCGTRMQNVGANRSGAEGGMAFPETLARDWLYAHPDGFVCYAATPEYYGSELVCRDVVVDVRSSDGALDLQIVVYNAAKGYTIDYADGTFAAA